jgi:hypothetical protein
MIALFLVLAATIEGTAFNRLTKNGVPGVTVRLTGPVEREAITTATGAFRIDDLPDGEYLATFEAPRGFVAPPSIRVRAGERLEAPFAPLGKIRGRVLDSYGRSVPSVEVRASNGESGSTGPGGEFRLTLPPGEYRLLARPTDRSTLPADYRDSGVWRWAPTWFPNALEAEFAQPITVSEGDDLDKYDIRLRGTPVYRLSGAVLDQEGKPVAGAAVHLGDEASTNSAEDGSFQFPAVRAADWLVRADLGGLAGSTIVPMGESDSEGTVVRLAPGFGVEAVVAGAPREGRLGLMLRLTRVDGIVESAMAVEDAEGRVRFENLHTGRYRVEALNTIPGLTPQLPGELELTPKSPPIRIGLRR